MTKKTFNLINAILTGIEVITIGVCTYLDLPNLTLINTSVAIGINAIIDICNTWVKED